MYSFKPKILDFKKPKKDDKIENTESKYTINEEYRPSEILSNQDKLIKLGDAYELAMEKLCRDSSEIIRYHPNKCIRSKS
jgi:hypothetical protein